MRLGRAPTPQCGASREPIGQDDGKGGPRGDDWGKKSNGRTRHILVETEGLLLKARVHPADETEAAGGRALLAGLAQGFSRLARRWIDGG